MVDWTSGRKLPPLRDSFSSKGVSGGDKKPPISPAGDTNRNNHNGSAGWLGELEYHTPKPPAQK